MIPNLLTTRTIETECPSSEGWSHLDVPIAAGVSKKVCLKKLGQSLYTEDLCTDIGAQRLYFHTNDGTPFYNKVEETLRSKFWHYCSRKENASI